MSDDSRDGGPGFRATSRSSRRRRTVVDRPSWIHVGDEPAAPEPIVPADLEIAPQVRIDFHLRGVWRQGHEFVPIPARTWAILVYLARHPNTAIPRRELIAVAWPGELRDPADLARHIHRIRQAVEPASTSREVLVTRRGIGYCFCMPVAPRQRIGEN